METVIFIGLQATGKSSFYLQKFYQTHIRLNLDMLKTRHREQLLVTACLEAKQSLVIDNTNPMRADRQRYIELARQHQFEVVGYYFQSRVAECLERNRLRSGKARVPDAAILNTYKKLELPKYEERFDRLYYVSLKDGDFEVEEYSDEV